MTVQKTYQPPAKIYDDPAEQAEYERCIFAFNMTTHFSSERAANAYMDWHNQNGQLTEGDSPDQMRRDVIAFSAGWDAALGAMQQKSDADKGV